jgi:hypothetical protein
MKYHLTIEAEVEASSAEDAYQKAMHHLLHAQAEDVFCLGSGRVIVVTAVSGA